MREKSLPKATVVGAIPSVFGTVAAASFFAMLGQPNLPIPGALLFSGLATAAVVVFVFRRSA
jgi:CDP-diglyceride synthetase